MPIIAFGQALVFLQAFVLCMIFETTKSAIAAEDSIWQKRWHARRLGYTNHHLDTNVFEIGYVPASSVGQSSLMNNDLRLASLLTRPSQLTVCY